MKSTMHGTNTLLNNEVTNISSLGFWMIIENKEYFISFKEYPIFKKSALDKIFNFKMLSPRQLHWKELDVDIELDALEHPALFPLHYK